MKRRKEETTLSDQNNNGKRWKRNHEISHDKFKDIIISCVANDEDDDDDKCVFSMLKRTREFQTKSFVDDLNTFYEGMPLLAECQYDLGDERMPDRYRNNRKIVMEAVTRKGWCLDYASDELEGQGGCSCCFLTRRIRFGICFQRIMERQRICFKYCGTEWIVVRACF